MMKVYSIDDTDYVASKSLEEMIIWYTEYICEIDASEEIKEVDIDKEGMWIPTKSEKDIRRLGDSDEIISSPPEPGDLMRTRGNVYKYTTFRRVLEENGEQEYIEPYVIASTEY